MRLGDRSSTILLAVITIALALAVGLIIPLAAGNSLGGSPQPWTPPPSPTPTSVPPTTTALPTVGAKSTSPTATRVQPTATPSAVATVAVTVTPTVTVALAPTAVISPTVTLIPSAGAAAPYAQVLQGPLNLRFGPDQQVISTAQVGQVFTITGRTADNAWLQVCCVNNASAWLAAQNVIITGTLTALPVRP